LPWADGKCARAAFVVIRSVTLPRSEVGVAVTIKRISPDEWPVLRDIRLRSLADSPEAFGQRYEEAASTTDAEWASTADASAEGNRRIWFIARDDADAAVGVVQARRRQPFDCLLFSMWVAPEARRLGVGASLVDAVQEWSKSWGAQRVVLWVLAGNERAMRFYDRIGFTVLSDGPDVESGRAYGAFAMERASPPTDPQPS
jgi:GNAT superfamily N-acetyltransferase